MGDSLTQSLLPCLSTHYISGLQYSQLLVRHSAASTQPHGCNQGTTQGLRLSSKLAIVPVGSAESFCSSLHGSTHEGGVIAGAGGLPIAFQINLSLQFPHPGVWPSASRLLSRIGSHYSTSEVPSRMTVQSLKTQHLKGHYSHLGVTFPYTLHPILSPYPQCPGQWKAKLILPDVIRINEFRCLKRGSSTLQAEVLFPTQPQSPESTEYPPALIWTLPVLVSLNCVSPAQHSLFLCLSDQHLHSLHLLIISTVSKAHFCPKPSVTAKMFECPLLLTDNT